jgi:hypothetical protein
MSIPTPPQDGAPSAAPGSDASPAPDPHDTVQPASPELLMIRRLAVGRLGSGPWADQCLVAQMEWAAVAGTGGMGGTATWGLRTGEPEGLTWET